MMCGRAPVVTRFYKEMFKRPVIDFEHAAMALNIAMVEAVKLLLKRSNPRDHDLVY